MATEKENDEKYQDTAKPGFFKRAGGKVKNDVKENINYKEISEASNLIKDMASEVFSPKAKIENAKKEKFEDAVKRMGLSDLDLMKNYKNFTLCFYASLVFSVICLGFLVTGIFSGNAGLLHLMALFVISIFCITNAFKYSFRAFQIKHRKLCSVKDWWKKGDYFPTFKI